MAEHELQGQPPVKLTLRRSPRARRITLRVSHLDGRVTITLPQSLPETEALEFARKKEKWIRGHLAGQSPSRIAVIGASIPVDGIERRIASGGGRTVSLEGDCILVPGSERQVPSRLCGWLKDRARVQLTDAADRYGAKLGKSPKALTLRDTRSRWGSCTSAGRLMFSWRLVMAPVEVLEYVAAHEVAHLQEMNHSPAFWSLVREIHGPFDKPRQWLRANGPALHRINFRNCAGA